MFPDWLLSSVSRRMSKRYLHFDSAGDKFSPSQADPDKQYLLYLHIPFCVVLCPFCSFHRVEFKEARARVYFEALRQEIRSVCNAGFRFNELYVGGGTPTVMPQQLLDTIGLVRELQPITSISTETNPDDIDDDWLPQLRAAGVNRLSVGVQSFDDRLLREMGRFEKYGSGRQIRRRLKHIEGLFDTLNIDMIFNFPDQSEQSLVADLEILTGDVKADQVSFYPLMTTESTMKPMRKNLGRVDHRRERRMYELITQLMLSSGYQRSSAWCFSRVPAMIDEYIITQDEYLGLGSGAFSFFGGHIYASTFSINHYIDRCKNGQSAIVRQRSMSLRDQMRYYLLTHLFSGSLNLDQADRHFAGRFRRSLRPELASLRLIRAVRRDKDCLRLTERGYYLWVVLMREFFSGVNNFREQMRHNISSEKSVVQMDAQQKSRQGR